VMSACEATPFLSAHRLVLVEGLLAAQEGRPRQGRARRGAVGSDATEAVGSPWATLPAFLQRMPPTTTLALVDGEVRANNWLLAALQGAGRTHTFPLLRREQLQQWVQDRALALQAPIAPRAVAALAESVGANLWQMDRELEKLSLYAWGRPIEEADVHAMVSVARTGTVFQLVDAIVAGKGGEAVRLARLLLDTGVAGPFLVTMIARQFRQLLLARDMHRRGLPRAEIARRTEIPDFRVMAVVGQAQRYPQDRLEAIYDRILEADLNIKRGIQDEDAAVEALVAEIGGLR
jgi:DNA polymerase-3 subunit delta